MLSLYGDETVLPARLLRWRTVDESGCLLTNLLDYQASGGQRTKQFGLRPGEVEPRQPVRAIKDDHLPVVNGRDVGTRLSCQEGERLPCPVGHRSPQAREAKPVLARLREFPLRFRRFGSSELEKMRGRDQAAPIREAPPL
jgi:hypothetical protein